MEEIFEERAKFVVVGQLTGTRERRDIPPSDPEAIKLSLGWYSTEGDARSAAESLWTAPASGDTYRVWALPVFHGSPAELHAKAKAKYEEAEAKVAEKARERLRVSIEKRELEDQIRAAGGKGSCEKCGHMPYDHRPEGSSKGKCALTDCGCQKWVEKKK